MFEPRLTSIERYMRELTWAVSPQRSVVLTLRERIRRALGWFVLGALCAALGVVLYAQRYPGEVSATDARLEQATPRYLVYSLGFEHRAVEVRCLLVVDRPHQAFTVSC